MGVAHAGLVATAAWVTAFMLAFFFAMKRLRLLRTPLGEEQVGLDATKHGGAAYTDVVRETAADGAWAATASVACEALGPAPSARAVTPGDQGSLVALDKHT